MIEGLKGKVITYHLQHVSKEYYDNTLKEFNHQKLLDLPETNRRIEEGILSDEPYMVCRFGATELATVKTFDFEVSSKYEGQLHRIHMLSGVYPETVEIGRKFTELMIEDMPYGDFWGIWPQAFEGYYLKKYGKKDADFTLLKNLNPWLYPEAPWTRALKGKKVLVIHPFDESISSQYERREQIFPGTEILPEFELDVLKSVQSLGGSDDRFATWFDAYEYMKEEALKRDFDVAILGCGAYGFPLAAEIKKAGKTAIHFGGAAQILFGIMGNRWNDDPVVNQYVNDAWVRPRESEKPASAGKVENSCYW